MGVLVYTAPCAYGCAETHSDEHRAVLVHTGLCEHVWWCAQLCARVLLCTALCVRLFSGVHRALCVCAGVHSTVRTRVLVCSALCTCVLMYTALRVQGGPCRALHAQALPACMYLRVAVRAWGTCCCAALCVQAGLTHVGMRALYVGTCLCARLCVPAGVHGCCVCKRVAVCAEPCVQVCMWVLCTGVSLHTSVHGTCVCWCAQQLCVQMHFHMYTALHRAVCDGYWWHMPTCVCHGSTRVSPGWARSGMWLGIHGSM